MPTKIQTTEVGPDIGLRAILKEAGKIKAAKALYEAMQARYDANWYGYLAKQRLTALGGRPRSAGDRTDAGR